MTNGKLFSFCYQYSNNNIINFINLMALTSVVSFFFLKDLFTGLVIFCFLL